MVALDLPMIPTNVTMKSSSSLVRKWVCREQEPSVGACEAPAAFQVSRIDDGPKPGPGDNLQKTRINDKRDSEKVESASVWQKIHTRRGNIKKKISRNGLVQSLKVSG